MVRCSYIEKAARRLIYADQGLSEKAQGVLAESEGANFTDSMMEITEIWSNDSCIGYFLRAAQIAGVDRDTIRDVLDAYSVVFEEISVDEAAKIYCEY